MVVIEGNDPSFEAYETPAYPSMLYHHIKTYSTGLEPANLTYARLYPLHLRGHRI